MFDQLQMAPADPILGLTEAFNKDTRPNKINLGVGIFKDEAGRTPVLDSVKKAETLLLAAETTKSYLPIPGDAAYGAAVQALLFGAGHEIVQSKRAVTAHTPGGTGGLRVAGDFLRQQYGPRAIWLSDPTWENHQAIFKTAGLEVKRYPYYDAATKGLDFDGMIAALETAAPGDVVLLHACCHNPSGIDPEAAQWARIAQVLHARQALPLVDFAYQGFGDGIDEDAAGLRELCKENKELLVCSSFSKNFGLYKERVGALTLVAPDADSAARAFSHVKIAIRTNYSNPPAHGGAVVSTVLADATLRKQWEDEVAAMRTRIHAMRELFVETLRARGVKQDFAFIARQKGMFSFSGLTREQVDALRERHALYIVGSGRINVAGMTPRNMDAICTAIAAVL